MMGSDKQGGTGCVGLACAECVNVFGETMEVHYL